MTAEPISGVLRLPRSIFVGAGQRHTLVSIVEPLGRSVLICTDRRLAESTELAELVAALQTADLDVAVFSETEAELPVDGIAACLASLRGRTVEVVIGLGGGSCIDMAKVLALLLAHGGAPGDYYGEFRVPGPTLPVVAIPTTAGTGSEATGVAVVFDPDLRSKAGISSPHLIPAVAICDPELTLSSPPRLTAATGADTLTHLVESFTAIHRPAAPGLALERVFIGATALTDHLALDGLGLLARSLPRAYTHGDDLTARADVMVAALYGGLALSNAGTAVAHAIQYPVGALSHTPHGVGVGTLLPYALRYNFEWIRPRLARIAVALGAASPSDDVDVAARRAIGAIDELLEAIEIPRTLADLGITQADAPTIAELAMNARRLIDNNPRPLDSDDVLAITLAAVTGDRSYPETIR